MRTQYLGHTSIYLVVVSDAPHFIVKYGANFVLNRSRLCSFEVPYMWFNEKSAMSRLTYASRSLVRSTCHLGQAVCHGFFSTCPPRAF